MRDLGFHEHKRSWRRTGSTRRNAAVAGDTSPNSFMCTLESNLSLFSSTSASVDRCSFASDAHDRDSLNSEISLLNHSLRCSESLSFLTNEVSIRVSKFNLKMNLQHLAGNGDFAPSESWSGPDPDLNLNPNRHQHAVADSVHRKKLHETIFSGKGEKTKVQKEDSDVVTEDGNQLSELDSARNSFSLALKECQDRRSRCEALFKKQDR